jgi:hypothetical protein
MLGFQHVQEEEDEDGEYGRQEEVWYRLLLSSLEDAACRDFLLQQEAAVLEQLQQAGEDARPVQTAMQEARMRKDLSRVQRRLRRQLSPFKDAGYF